MKYTIMNVRIWIIGAWDHMMHHVEAFKGLDDFEIVAITDPNKEAIERALKSDFLWSMSLQNFERAEDMYDWVEIDAVISATPDRFHLSNLKDALQRGKHIMLEKPLVANSSELWELVQILRWYREKWLIVSSCHPRRFDFPQLGLKEILPQLWKELWKVMSFDYDFSYVTLKKRGLHEWLLVDHFNHEIDLLNFLFWYCDFIAHKLTDSEDRYEAAWVRWDKITFHFKGTRFLDANSSNYPEFMRIRFEKWEVTIETKTWKVTIRNDEKSNSRESQIHSTDYIKRLRWVNRNFIEAILGKQKPYLTWVEMLLNTSSALSLASDGIYNSQRDPYMESYHKLDEWKLWNAKWELIQSDSIPEISRVTAVTSIIIWKNGQIFLTKNNDTKKDRNWDLPGWHVEEGETIETTGRRELFEEAWIQAKDYKIVGYIKFSSSENIERREWGFYPNPSYIAVYLGSIDWKIETPTWDEIETSQSFSLDEALAILWSDIDKALLRNLL